MYVISNSEKSLSKNFKTFFSTENITLIENRGNLGIACALNQAMKYAIRDGFELLLTMDQDSKISETLVASMIRVFENDDKIGIVCPNIVHKKNSHPTIEKHLKEVKIAMTSGSIIRLSLVNVIGEFKDKFFIDYVDYEYSLRVLANGYKIIKLNDAFVFHSLGNMTEKRIFSIRIFPTNHSAIRYYYRTRNRFNLYKLYQAQFPEVINKDKLDFIKEIIKLLLLEKEKILKLQMILKGYCHFRKNIFGPLKKS